MSITNYLDHSINMKGPKVTTPLLPSSSSNISLDSDPSIRNSSDQSSSKENESMKKLRKTAAFARTSQESSANNSSDNATKFIYDVNQAA